jgi:hypothetical protein
MARPVKLSKTVSAANLEKLGSARLAALLVDAATSQPAFRRRLRLELAAEIGAPDLALEIGKRLAGLSGSRARISWRKRPELVREIRDLRRLVVERIMPDAPSLALETLAGLIDLSGPLSGRVKDPRGELTDAFLDIGPALVAALAAAPAEAGHDLVAGRTLASPDAWVPILASASPELEPGAARALLDRLGQVGGGRITRLRRRLADQVGDLEAWRATLTPDELRQPEILADLSARLASAGQPQEARTALDRALAAPGGDVVKVRRAVQDAEIAVLEAEGRPEEAAAARWARFETRLSVESLRAITDRLADFEDVEAANRGLEIAARASDLMAGLALLMAWGAHGEAADAIEARSGELRGDHDDLALWAARIGARRPEAAQRLLQVRIEHLHGAGEPIDGLLAEAEALALISGDAASHQAFVAELERARRRPLAGRRRP